MHDIVVYRWLRHKCELMCFDNDEAMLQSSRTIPERIEWHSKWIATNKSVFDVIVVWMNRLEDEVKMCKAEMMDLKEKNKAIGEEVKEKEKEIEQMRKEMRTVRYAYMK